MPDTRMSGLATLLGANLATGDLFVLTDISDNSMAATGTDKSMTGNELALGLARLVGLSTGWLNDANTWVFGSSTAFGINADATGYLKRGDKISYNDGAVDYAHVGVISFLPASPVTGCVATIATSLFTKTAHGLTNGLPVVP